MYTRLNPSPRYNKLLSQYQQLHEQGEKNLGISPEKTFPGFSVLPQVDRIKRLVVATKSFSVLDYGCGKGMQYKVPIVDIGTEQKEMLADYWGLTAVQLYDPCYPPYANLPKGRFDGVISTDMLEHCSEEDVPWIVDEMFSFAGNFLFANVACYPAKKKLPNDENAHCTIKEPQWWSELFESVSERYPDVIWEVVLTYIKKTTTKKTVLQEAIISSKKRL